MQVEEFWQHWQVTEDPFRAEEARHDPVFRKVMDTQTTHPDFEKVFGEPTQPSAAVVFGEKGSGKTALRLLLEKRILAANADDPDNRAWIVRYDDLNPILDRFAHSHGVEETGDNRVLERFRLADHQDAILSQVVTRLIDSLVGAPGSAPLSDESSKAIRQMPREMRVDLAILAALYDQPRSGSVTMRWRQLRRVLRLGGPSASAVCKWAGVITVVLALGLLVAGWVRGEEQTPGWHFTALVVLIAAAIGLLGYWAVRGARLWWLGRRIDREIHVVDRSPGQLRQLLADLPARDVGSAPLPLPGDQDSRYQLTARLLDCLDALGYKSLIVLFDRVDEPAMINGDAEKMRALIWPMLNNKFLQQDRVGVKLLLPLELRHLLRREDADFFQRARLDKQHMIDRLVWSGTTLYDLCTRRLRACRAEGAAPVISLTDLFDEDVTRQDLIDALDQMQQPRDAFKFLYQTIQEHCSNVPHDEPTWRIPRLTLHHVRKEQTRRIQELQRGLSPA